MPLPGAPVKVGVTLSGVHPRFRVAAAQAAEESGFAAVWLPEHLVFPVQTGGNPHGLESHPPIPAETPTYDVFVSLAMIAAATTTLRFGTNVYNIGLRHPFVVARAVASLDALSGGRLDFGIGSSWLREEWEAAGLDFSTRGARVDEVITICRRLWTEAVIEHHGRYFHFEPVAFNPKPEQRPHPPLIIGGDGAAARRRAATIGDSWFPLNHPFDELPSALRDVNARRAAAGRAGTTTLTLSTGTNPRPELGRYTALGVEHLITRPYTSSKSAIDEIRRYGEEVLSR